MKEVATRIVSWYVAIGEIPFLVKFLVLTLGAAAGVQPDPDAIGELMALGIVGAVIPWWIEPLQWLSLYPVLAVLFLYFGHRWGLMG